MINIQAALNSARQNEDSRKTHNEKYTDKYLTNHNIKLRREINQPTEAGRLGRERTKGQPGNNTGEKVWEIPEGQELLQSREEQRNTILNMYVSHMTKIKENN